MQYRNLINLWEAFQSNDVETAATITGTDIAFNGTTGAVTTTSTDLSALNDGDWIFISGTTSNNGWKGPITSAGAMTITLPAAQVTTEAAGASMTLKLTERLVLANTQKSFSVEWNDPTLTNKFRSGTGFVVTDVSVSWSQGSIVTEEFTLAGQAPVRGSATIGTGSPTAAPTSGFMNAVGDFGKIYVDNAQTSAIITELSINGSTIQDPARGLGNLGPSSFTEGDQQINLSGTMLYDDNSDAIFSNIEDHDTVSLFWDTVDAQGNRLGFYIPALKADEGEPDVGEPGTRVSMPFTFSGHDPAKDSSSAHVSDGFGFQFALFLVDA